MNPNRHRILVGTALVLAFGSWSPAQVQFIINSPAEALCNTRDLNADGRRELVLGVPSADRVEVRSGHNGALLSASSGGVPVGSRFGAAVDVIGDVNMDGIEDLAVGAPLRGVTGVVVVISASNGAVLRSFGPRGGHPITCPTHPKLYGFSVKAIGDLNGDGFSELAVGAPGWEGPGCIDQGIVEIVDVRPTTPTIVNVVSNPTLTTNGTWSCSTIHDVQFGYSLAAPSDLNGDGVPDLAIGAPGANLGFAYDGATCRAGFIPFATALVKGGSLASIGVSMSGIGDLDADLVGDLVVGAPNLSLAPANLATTYRYSGRALGAAGGNVVPPLGALGLGAAFGRQLGWSIARIRDLDGDGVQDFVAGAGSPCNLIPGAHYLFSGATGGLLQFVAHPGSPTYGQAVYPTGNSNGNRLTFMVADPASSQVTVRS